MIPKKVLILYGAPGSGHAQVASALAQAINKTPGWMAHEDHLLRHWPALGGLLLRLYRWVLGHMAGAWGRLHGNPRYLAMARRAESVLYGLDIFRIQKILDRHQPHLVIAVHVLPLRCLAVLKAGGKFSLPLYAVITDFWAHSYWPVAGVERYFASSK